MKTVPGSDRIHANKDADAAAGRVLWAPAKSLWIGGMSVAALALAPLTFSWSALAVFLLTSAVTLCFGHSVGLHRRLIHNSFACPLWLEYLCVYLGTLVGMAGPLEMIRIHDMRDWAQRQACCHDYFAHRAGFWRDGWRQLHCRLALTHSPRFRLEPRLQEDRFYRFLERGWMLQQVPPALLLFVLGGTGWVAWGICLRVAVCVTGHWLVGHFAHRQGEQTWIVRGAAVQGYDVRLAGLISMGESWHNNHHAFPGSARLGLLPGQTDAGWWLIQAFARLGLARDIVTPDILPPRPALLWLGERTDPEPRARAGFVTR